MFETALGVGLAALGGVGLASAATIIGVSSLTGVSADDPSNSGANTVGAGTSVYGN